MKVLFKIENKDIDEVKRLYEVYRDNPHVSAQINIKKNPKKITRSKFWFHLVSCLLTTQQRSGKGSRVINFLNQSPFPLDFKQCGSQENLEKYVYAQIEKNGLRFKEKIAKEVSLNYSILKEKTNWDDILTVLRQMNPEKTITEDEQIKVERLAADKIKEKFIGIGLKQSRNLLKDLNLSKWEIPIDTRVINWISGRIGAANPERFLVTTSGLGSEKYYLYIQGVLQELSKKAEVYPCVLDAIIWESGEKKQTVLVY